MDEPPAGTPIGSSVRMASQVLSLILLGVVGSEALASPAPQVRRNARLRMEVTAYCTKGETASGEQTRRGIVAADPNVLPLGSRVRVDGLGRPHDRVYDVEDTGREVKGRELDIFMQDCQAAKRFGRRTARVRVLQVGDDAERAPAVIALAATAAGCAAVVCRGSWLSLPEIAVRRSDTRACS